MARHRAKHGLKQPSGFDLRPRRLRESHNLYKCQPGIMEGQGKENCVSHGKYHQMGTFMGLLKL